MKVSVKNLLKLFGSCSGVIKCICRAIGKKTWHSAWLFIPKQKDSWFIIERAFWKQIQNIQSVNLLEQSDIIDEKTSIYCYQKMPGQMIALWMQHRN